MPSAPADISEHLKDQYTTTEIALLIATRIQQFGEDKRLIVDKVRKRLDYATKKGDLHKTATGDYCASEIHPWMRKKWPDKFDDIAVEHFPTAMGKVSVSTRASMLVLPGNLDRCHAALTDAHVENRKLLDQLQSAQTEIAELKPLAEKYLRICEENARSAKLPRDGSL